MGIVNDRENCAECAHIARLSLEDAHGSQHPSRYRDSAALLGMDFVDHMIGSGRVDDIARMLGVAEHDPVDWVEWIRFRARFITVLRRCFHLLVLLATFQLSEGVGASRRTRREASPSSRSVRSSFEGLLLLKTGVKDCLQYGLLYYSYIDGPEGAVA